MVDLSLEQIGKTLVQTAENVVVNQELSVSVSIPIDSPKENNQVIAKEPILNMELNIMSTNIDWTNPDCNITEHFTVKDAIMLHSWNRLANESDGLTDEGKEKLQILCQKMEEVRQYLGCPINVHCMYRSEKYNKEAVGAIPKDVHQQFLAADIDCHPVLSIEQVKEKMEPKLEEFGIRMERHTTTWVHLDLHKPGVTGRYFTA
jgi:hypothetical protein